ncbi:3699_t:CDS:2 [Gigaspora margarita]|uniref:3699_t:CDS:1 n=1 Tax=Gigaspora margarita TaxID=4874 RepID=A0ABN7UAI7_GIGMA|nr:3699_t:CDS:2 [Gigaspora margarita]
MDAVDNKQKAKNAASIAAPAAITRSLILQGLTLFYRTPIKLFRPLRVDYLVMARAIMPPPSENAKKFSFHHTNLGMISNAVKLHGFSFIHRHILPPFIANSVIGAVLFTVYVSTLSQFQSTPISGSQHYINHPPPFYAVFCCGAIAGATQSLVAAPLDSLKVRFEVNDLLEGKHKSMYDYAMTTWKELGLSSIYRGIGLTLIKDSLSCGLFFGIFELIKGQCYNSYINKMDNHRTIKYKNQDRDNSHFIEPAFILVAGGLAAISYHIIDYPLDRIRNVFLIEEAQSEFQHEQKPKLYKLTWEQCKLRALRTGWMHFLYGDFGATVLRAIPATSVGFLVFELMKKNLDYKDDLDE